MSTQMIESSTDSTQPALRTRLVTWKEPVSCEGQVIQGSRIATAEARLTDAAGKLYAHGSTTCLIFPIDEVRQAI